MSGELRLSPRRNAGSRPATGYAIADLADDVIGVLDALGIEGAVLARHSASAARSRSKPRSSRRARFVECLQEQARAAAAGQLLRRDGGGMPVTVCRALLTALARSARLRRCARGLDRGHHASAVETEGATSLTRRAG
jgi:hypothetical protein